MPDNIWNEIKKPSGKLAFILAIMTIPLTIYVASLFEKHGAPTYDVQQVIAFDQAKISSESNNNESLLYVVDRNGTKINKNVYAATLKIWNNGTANIKPEDVRIPFKISLSGTNDIIKFKEITETGENMDHFSLSDDDHTLSWVNFDPNQGVTISIVYASAAESKISLSGYAVNSKETQITDKGTTSIFDRRQTSQVIKGLVVVFGITISDRFTEGFYKRWFKSRPRDIVLAIIGFMFAFASFLYLLQLIDARDYISYAPF